MVRIGPGKMGRGKEAFFTCRKRDCHRRDANEKAQGNLSD